jgi:hypothetical protein
MRFDMVMEMSSPQLSQPATMTLDGAVDNERRRMQMDIDLSGLTSALGGAGTSLGDPSDWKGEQIGDFSDGNAVVYMSLPFLAKVLPGAKRWVKLDLNAAGAAAGIDISQFTQLSSDPARMLDWLRAASGNVTTVGTETVDGVETTHYRATIDLGKYPNLVPPDQHEAMQKAIDSLLRSGSPRTFPVDAWVGSDGLIRRQQMSLKQTVDGVSMEVDLTMNFRDFGSPVEISLPQEDDVSDLAQMTTGG